MLTRLYRPDPAEWCPRGYAIVNVDIRGTWESEGNIYIEGSQMGTLAALSPGRNALAGRHTNNRQVLMAMIPSNSLQPSLGAMVLSACVAIPGWRRSSGQLLFKSPLHSSASHHGKHSRTNIVTWSAAAVSLRPTLRRSSSIKQFAAGIFGKTLVERSHSGPFLMHIGKTRSTTPVVSHYLFMRWQAILQGITDLALSEAGTRQLRRTSGFASIRPRSGSIFTHQGILMTCNASSIATSRGSTMAGRKPPELESLFLHMGIVSSRYVDMVDTLSKHI